MKTQDPSLSTTATKTPRLKVIICGGGIAGFATALLLREDHDITILESSTLNEELGAAITLSMNGSRILRSSLARAGFDKDKARFVEAEKFQELHWQDLSVILEWQMDWVTKRDVIIGADGIRTASGRSVFGNLQTESQGLSAYRCMISSQGMREDPQTAILVDSAKVLILVGADKRIVAYPCSSWEWMNFVCIFPDNTERRSQWNTKVTVQEMVDVFKNFHPSITKALSMATDTGVWQLRDRKPMSTLTKGCFALIGDAAHAMGPHQGQGGCQAIEDAEALRVVLKGTTRDDVANRLKIFDELRVERVATVINYTRAMAPKPTTSKEVNHQSTQTYSDYYWRYKITQEAVELMQKLGYKMNLVNVTTGEISLD